MNPIQKFATAALVLFLGLTAGHAAGQPGPRACTAAQMLKVKPADCAGCHKDAKVLPAGHVATKGMGLKDCQACHQAGQDKPGALETRVPGSHLHALNGVRCAQCHDDLKKPQSVPMWKCTSCHDPKELAARSAAVQPRNPHNTRHYGDHPDCNKCHHQHRKSENDCAQCHPFSFQVP